MVRIGFQQSDGLADDGPKFTATASGDCLFHRMVGSISSSETARIEPRRLVPADFSLSTNTVIIKMCLRDSFEVYNLK